MYPTFGSAVAALHQKMCTSMIDAICFHDKFYYSYLTCVCHCAADDAVLSDGGPQLVIDQLPATLGNLNTLEELHLSMHWLSNSSLPAELAMLSNLTVLWLSGPTAAGSTLPAEWSVLSRLRSLRLLRMYHLSGNV
jgi:hypothetical protein